MSWMHHINIMRHWASIKDQVSFKLKYLVAINQNCAFARSLKPAFCSLMSQCLQNSPKFLMLNMMWELIIFAILFCIIIYEDTTDVFNCIDSCRAWKSEPENHEHCWTLSHVGNVSTQNLQGSLGIIQGLDSVNSHFVLPVFRLFLMCYWAKLTGLGLFFPFN